MDFINSSINFRGKGTQNEKLQNDIISNSIKVYEKKTGSRKRKCTFPKKIPRLQYNDIFTDLNLNFTENNFDKTDAIFDHKGMIHSRENNYNDGTNKNSMNDSNLFQFLEDNFSQKYNFCSEDDKKIASNDIEDEVLVISEYEECLQNNNLEEKVGLNGNQDVNFDENIQKKIVEENWDFCKMAMAADTTIIFNFLSPAFLEDENFIENGNDTKHDGEVNYNFLSSEINIGDNSSLFDDNRIVNEESYLSYDQARNNNMQITESLDMSAAFIAKPILLENLTEDNSQAVDVLSIDDLFSTLDILNFGENNMLFESSNLDYLHTSSSHNNREYTNHICINGHHNFCSSEISFRRENNNESVIKREECKFTEAEMENIAVDQIYFDCIDISNETPQEKNEVSIQSKMPDIGEQFSTQSKLAVICPTISHVDTLEQKEFQNSLLHKKQSTGIVKFENVSEQITKASACINGKRKLNIEQSSSKKTKRRKAASEDKRGIIHNLIKKYIENKHLDKFSFNDITDFLTKSMPNTVYFEILNDATIFFMNNLKTGVLKLIGRK